ncbi:ribosomal RNA large subunit methyltransferase J [Ostertagia ostertagi]
MFAESSDSESDAPSAARDQRLSALAKTKHEDLKETFEEEYDHYKDSEPPPAKVVATDSKPMSNAERMMAKMGYKEGKGLGKTKQGAVEPVALSTQRGRVGLGHNITKKNNPIDVRNTLATPGEILRRMLESKNAPLFYFADVCAGPGGFSEYMLWRKAFYNVKGFGFTLKGKDDFKLGKFYASSAHYFEPYYGKEGDGDVTKPENINSLEEFIMKGTNDVGVDLMMADGGFSSEAKKIFSFYGREDFSARLPPFAATLLSERTIKELRYAEFSLNILSNRASTQPELLISTGVDNKRLETVAVDGLVRILDAAVLNGDDVSGLLYSKRMAAAQKFCLALKLIVPKVRLGWGNHERYVVPPQLVVAGAYSFDQLAQVRRKFSRVRHSGEEVLVYDENGYLLMCKAFRVARLLKEAWKMGWSCSRSMTYAFCPQRPDLGSFFEPQWEEHECCSSFWESAMPSKQTTGHVPMQCIWSWENSLLDNYGPRVILENDSHKSGPTVNSVLREVAETDEQCRKSVAA